MDEQYEESYQSYYETQIPHREPEMPSFVPPTPKPKKKHTGVKLCALALVCALLGGVAGAGGVLWLNGRNQPAAMDPNTTQILVAQRETAVLDTVPVDTGKVMTAAQVYAANVNSTVGITTSVTTNYWGYQTTSAASGSGFIITQDGYILTNYHVIEGANSVTVACYDGTTYDASVVGYDESNDLAVLKVDAEGLTPVILGDSDLLNVGDSVVAIGNPLGELTFSLTAGLVSAKDREVTMSNSVTMDLLQTDCAINSGNSGGALLNLYGEVVGITNAKYSSSSSSSASIDNIGFAIPINSVKSIVESIIEKGYISKPYIGVSVLDVSQQTQAYGIPAGAAIQEVTQDSPAQQAGLVSGDIITAVDGEAITGSQDLVTVIGNAQVGQELKLTVYRQGQTLELLLTVGEQIQSAQADAQTEPTSQQSQYQGGNGYSGFPFGGFFGGRW